MKSVKEIKNNVYIGFTIFDIIHFFGSIALLIFLNVNKPENYQHHMAECLIGIVFAVLLVAFIFKIAKKCQTIQEKRTDLTYALLVACSSVLAGSAFFVATMIETSTSAMAMPFWLQIIFALFAIAFFIVALLKTKKECWQLFLLLGLISILFVTPCNLIFAIMEGGPLFLVITRCIISIAPIFPFIFVFIGLIYANKNSGNPCGCEDNKN